MLLEAWDAQVKVSAQAVILPDGCRDLLFTAPAGGRPRWEITNLDDTAYSINMQAGSYFKGFRLHAGAEINTTALLATLQGLPPDHDGILDRLMDFTKQEPLVKDTLEALAEQAKEGGSTAKAAVRLGLGQRRMQRLMAHHTGRSAMRWLGLARVRLAARAIGGGQPLADIAYDFGFADQPHMTRAFRRWFATSPGAMRKNTKLAATLSAAGYA
ncbi:MAG: helix-turn-helix domain-containing protein [Rhodobacteraceae bacterium]|nr:helix-turn-helix domain-containing protein [Paracoccaceae bacterium]